MGHPVASFDRGAGLGLEHMVHLLFEQPPHEDHDQRGRQRDELHGGDENSDPRQSKIICCTLAINEFKRL